MLRELVTVFVIRSGSESLLVNQNPELCEGQVWCSEDLWFWHSWLFILHGNRVVWGQYDTNICVIEIAFSFFARWTKNLALVKKLRPAAAHFLKHTFSIVAWFGNTL